MHESGQIAHEDAWKADTTERSMGMLLAKRWFYKKSKKVFQMSRKKPPHVKEKKSAHMTSPTAEAIKIVGDFRELPDSFYMAIARLLLAAHDADRAREKTEAEMAKEET